MYIVTYQYSYIMLRKYSTPKSWVTIVEERSSPAWRAGDCGRPDQAPAAGSDWPSTPEENQGKTMGKLWKSRENHGKFGKTRRKTMGKPWENCGNQGKTMGNLEKLWENCGNQGKQNIDSWGKPLIFLIGNIWGERPWNSKHRWESWFFFNDFPVWTSRMVNDSSWSVVPWSIDIGS